MRKAIAIFCTIICAISVFSVNLAADSTPTIHVETVTANAGDTVKVKIDFKNNPGIAGVTLKVKFATEALRLIAVESDLSKAGGNFVGPEPTWFEEEDQSQGISLVYSRLDDYLEKDFTFVTLTFEINEAASAGKHGITANYDVGNIFNANYDDVDFAIENGYVIIKSTTCSHKNTKKVDKVPATCVDTGVKAHEECLDCGKLLLDGKEVTEEELVLPVDPNNHVGGTEVKNKKEATCSEEGYTGDTYCKSCGAKIKSGKPIEKLPHTPSAEWSKDEKNHWHICTVCKEKLDEAEHDMKWTTQKEATEDEEGLEKGVCTVCKYETERATPKKDHEHKYGEDWKSDAENHWHECPCGEKSEEAAHTFDWTVIKEAAEEEEGLEKGICSVCKYETERVIPKKDHEHKYGEDWKSDADSHWHECSCREKSDVAAHTYEWTTVKKATEEEEGLEKGVCSVCKYETEREIPKKGHIHTMTYVPGKPATCVAVGTREHWRCEGCGKLFADNNGKNEITSTVIPVNPANHLFSGNTCVYCGYTRVVNNFSGAPVYLSETLHGIYINGQMIPYPHTADGMGMRTDGVSSWYVCGVCGHEFGKTVAVSDGEPADAVQVIDVDTPTEAGDNSEEVESDKVDVTDNVPEKSVNPKTGIAFYGIPAIIALLVVAGKKR